MNLNCPICAELFLPSDDVSCTTCGHLFHYLCLSQWLERSKTCPQCRHKCNSRNIFKVYFSQACLDSSRIDVGSLQEQLDNANLSNKLKDTQLSKANKEILELKEIQKRCKQTIAGLEDKIASQKFTLDVYKEKHQFLNAEVKATQLLRTELATMKLKLKQLESVNDMMAANHDETELLLKDNKDARGLAFVVVSMKKELANANTKKTEMRNNMRALQQQVRKASDAKKMLSDKLAALESENFHLKQELESKQPTEKGLNLGEINPITEKEEPPKKIFNKNHAVIYFNDSPSDEHVAKRSKMSVLDRLNNPSPGIKERVRQLEESKSPYLQIKSSNVDINTLFQFRSQQDQKPAAVGKTSSLPQQKLGIFSKNKGLLARSKPTSNLVFDGFGGSSKPSENDFPNRDLFPNDPKTQANLCIANRLKAGKLRKLPIPSS